MTSPIISVDVARRLNEIIQNTLYSRLFLFCNYEPTNLPAVSEEGKYLVAVQDLYKFAIDSSCILKKSDDYLPFAFRPSYSRIGEIVKLYYKPFLFLFAIYLLAPLIRINTLKTKSRTNEMLFNLGQMITIF